MEPGKRTKALGPAPPRQQPPADAPEPLGPRPRCLAADLLSDACLPGPSHPTVRPQDSQRRGVVVFTAQELGWEVEEAEKALFSLFAAAPSLEDRMTTIKPALLAALLRVDHGRDSIRRVGTADLSGISPESSCF